MQQISIVDSDVWINSFEHIDSKCGLILTKLLLVEWWTGVWETLRSWGIVVFFVIGCDLCIY